MMDSKNLTWFTFANLYQAYLDCRKRKTKTLNHLRFAENLEQYLLELERQLNNRTYKPGRSIAFVVEKPKIREIFAADFRDRVVHHLLYNYLAPIYERQFIHDSWACRKNKGTHRAMMRLKSFVGEASGAKRCCACKFGGEVEKSTLAAASTSPRGFFLKMDIKSFFTSIDRQILFNLLSSKVKNQEILWLAKVIIFHDCSRDPPPKVQSRPELFNKLPKDKSLFTAPKDKGLPIGNLTSQFFANVYLNELDQFVKHELKARCYVRYVDDFVILSDDRVLLERFRQKIGEFLRRKLCLCPHPKKQKISPIKGGIDFVGYFIKPDYVLVRRRVVGEYRHRLNRRRHWREVDWSQVRSSYFAHFKWANSWRLMEKFKTGTKLKIKH